MKVEEKREEIKDKFLPEEHLDASSKTYRLMELGELAKKHEDYRIYEPLNNFFVGYIATRRQPTPKEKIPELCEDFKELGSYLSKEGMMRSGELVASLKNMHAEGEFSSLLEQTIEDNITEYVIREMEKLEYK